MKHYKHLEVGGTLSVEITETILSGTPTEPKHVLGVYVTEVTAVENMDAVIRIYKNTQRVVDLPIVHTLQDNATSLRAWPPFIPLDLDLEAGDTLDVGCVSGGTASDLDFAVVYEVKGR